MFFTPVQKIIAAACVFLLVSVMAPGSEPAAPLNPPPANVAARPDGEPAPDAVPAGAVSDAGGNDPAPKGETPEEAAARAGAEHREIRVRERQELLEKAERFIETADETIRTSLPYPLNLLFGVSFFGITLWRFVAGVGLLILCFVLIFLVTRRFRSAVVAIEDGGGGRKWLIVLNVMFLALRTPLKLIIFAIFIRLASSLIVTEYHPDIVWISSLLLYFGAIMYVFDLVGIVDRVYGDRIFHSDDRLMETVRPIILKIVRVIILVVAGMHIYQNITGQPMISLLAGLGIGGLAVALASQETLQNLLGFASIAFDKAFLVGDAVSIASYDGTVERVGMRSLLLRTYDGNSVVIPNATAINSNIVNKNRRPYIRQEIRIALSALNTFARVERAMELIQEAVDAHEGKVPGLPPVVRFADFEPARFIIQALFWYDAEKPYFPDECSRVNLEICRRLSEAGILYAER